MQNADQFTEETVLTDQPSLENVSIGGNTVGNVSILLAPNDRSGIMEEGTQGEFGNGAEDADDPDGQAAEDAGEIYYNNLDDFINNPNRLNNIKPANFYNHLKSNGYAPKPLSHGSTAGIPFEQGGGFKINWGGDRILQYHPGGGIHVGSYWKVSSGATGTIKVPISGTYKP